MFCFVLEVVTSDNVKENCACDKVGLFFFFFFDLCYSQQTNWNQCVGVEIKHSLSSHDGKHYLHERNKDAAEVA